MKAVIGSLLLMFSAQSFAATSQPNPLTQLEFFYYRLSEEPIGENYYINFSTQIRPFLGENPLCQDANNFKNTSSSKVIETMSAHLTKAIDHAYDGSDGWFDRIEEREHILKNLKKALAGKKITTCVSKTFPRYSDGNEATFVKVDGKMAFVFEVGFPQ